MEFTHLCLHPIKSSIGQTARKSVSLLEENTDYQVSLLKNKLHWRKGECACVCVCVCLCVYMHVCVCIYIYVFFITELAK